MHVEPPAPSKHQTTHCTQYGQRFPQIKACAPHRDRPFHRLWTHIFEDRESIIHTNRRTKPNLVVGLLNFQYWFQTFVNHTSKKNICVVIFGIANGRQFPGLVGSPVIAIIEKIICFHPSSTWPSSSIKLNTRSKCSCNSRLRKTKHSATLVFKHRENRQTNPHASSTPRRPKQRPWNNDLIVTRAPAKEKCRNGLESFVPRAF